MADTLQQDPAAPTPSSQDVSSYDSIMAPPDATEDQPLYRVVGESRIPVSKHRGPLWKSRFDQAGSAMKSSQDAWDEAYRYYRNDHTRNTPVRDDVVNAGADAASQNSTENLVFANTSAMVPMLFTKNPEAEFTVEDENDKPLARVTQRLVNTLAAKKTSPGLNLKRKVKRNIVSTVLCNVAWFEVGYVLRENSSEQALMELQMLSEELVKAEKQDVIREIEGKLMALESKIDMLSPPGPWVKVRRPGQVRVDTTGTELDLSDSNWVMIEDLVPTSLLRALYGKKKPDSDQWESVFEPSHIIKPGSGSADSERGQTDNFQLFSYGNDDTPNKYGYSDRKAFAAAQMTKVVYVWDKVTRRCELYNANDWCYPLWVWNDPYGLDQFFPIVCMEFHTDPSKMYAKGEVTYYLDQQDDINLINGQFAKVRKYAAGKFIYDKNSLKDSNIIDALAAGTFDGNGVPVDLPEGKALKDVIAPLLPPVAEALQVFDKKPVMEIIDRLSGVASVQRGVEYKTNTTNRAIESYESQMQTRADEKMDAIEDSVGTVLWLVAQMCLQFMEQPQVASILGDKWAADWQTMTPDDIRAKFTPRVVGGSTLKPTSRAKKEQALQISGVVGQFAGASPVAAIVALKVLARAFDNVSITLEDWEMIYQGIANQIGAQSPQPEGAPPQQGGDAPPQGGPPQQPQAQPPQSAGADTSQLANIPGIGGVVQEVARLIDQLPEEIKQTIGIGLARGQSVQDIATEVIQSMQQGAAH